MSVIFGIKETNSIILGSDKRGSTKEGIFITDYLNKIIVINEHLALASAGNAVVEKAIMLDINNMVNKALLNTHDLLNIIKSFYIRVANANCSNILDLPFYFLIAGKGNDGKACLISGLNKNGAIDAKEVPMALYPPADVKMQFCCDCFAKNYHANNDTFVEKTIKDISNVSDLVSSTGNKWIYNITTEKSEFFSF
ncbi:MAG: hypothetical protein IJM97_07720 [Clostridia bacterium]|nr:hypothetical protein [Clostridia bacterium]